MAVRRPLLRMTLPPLPLRPVHSLRFVSGSTGTVSCSVRSVGSSGEGVGTQEGSGKVLFVAGALPLEVVEVRVTKEHARHSFGEMTALLSAPSGLRVEPPCGLAVPGQCGGCQVMHMRYTAQLQAKTDKVAYALQRIGRQQAGDMPTVRPCVPSPRQTGYRNKMLYQAFAGADGQLELGKMRWRSRDCVPVATCLLQGDAGQAVYAEVRALLRASGLRPCGSGASGDLRGVLLRSSMETGEVLVTMLGSRPPSDEERSLARELAARCPAVCGVLWNIMLPARRSNYRSRERNPGGAAEDDYFSPEQRKGEDSALPPSYVLGERTVVLHGQDSFLDSLCGLKFKVTAGSFFQVCLLACVTL